MSGKGGKKDDKKKDEKKEDKAPKKKKELTEEQLNPSLRKQRRKARFEAKLKNFMQEFNHILLVGVDNVGSSQMQEIRLALRGKAELLMGKNTMIRKLIKDNLALNPKFEALIPHVIGNIGFVFTNQDLNDVRTIIFEKKVPAAAKTGAFAPSDVFVPAGPTGLDPGQTSFFQALQIPTKIAKGAIEIEREVHLIKKGDKVTASAVALLTKLGIKPFFYGMSVQTVYENGSVYSAAVLDINPEDLLKQFFLGVRFAAALGLQANYPCLATIPHTVGRAFKFALGLSIATDYTFEESKSFKEYLANPDAFKVAAPVAAASSGSAPAAAAAAPVEEEEEDDGDVFGGGLFD